MAKRNQASEEGQVQDLRPRPVRLTSDMSLPKLSAVEIGSYVLMLFGMWAVIHLKLLGALLAGLLVFQLVHTIAPRIERHMSSGRARLAGGRDSVGGDRGRAHGPHARRHRALRERRAERAEAARPGDATDRSGARLRIPQFMASSLPVDTEQMKAKAAELMQTHAQHAPAKRQDGGARVHATF